MTFPALSANTSSGYFLNKSLRFRSAASAYMNRTPASATNRRTYTWSGWIKRGKLGVAQGIFEAIGSGGLAGKGTFFSYQSNDQIAIQLYDSTYNTVWNTTAVYRDPSSWYHFVLAVDTTQASQSNMVKLYVNGIQQSLTVTNYSATLPQNYDTFVNNTVQHNINTYTPSSAYGDQYFAEVNFVDGQALTPSSFGSTNGTTGVWQPIKYTGTYGTNGFYLPFTNNTSVPALGYDSSGNGNNWTANNFSLTAGSTYDSMTDVPTLTSSTVSNTCVLNPISNNTGSPLYTLTNGNLKYDCTASAGNAGRMAVAGTTACGSGKYYWEIKPTSTTNLDCGITAYMGTITSNASQTISVGIYNGGTDIVLNSATYTGTTPSFSAGDVLAFAFDGTAGTMGWYKNNSLIGTFSNIDLTKSWTPYFVASTGAQDTNFTVNFGQQPYTYTPPTGYLALNTYNLQGSTIPAGNKYMDATLYTGAGTTQSIVNSGGFQTDFVWLKCRSNSSNSHYLYDSIRGVTKSLTSNNQDAQQTVAQTLTSFNSNGFTLGTAGGSINGSGLTFVGWQWQAGQGTTTLNTSGSVNSTVSVNSSAGFSICTFNSGAAGNQSFGHGLGVTPQFVIVKDYGTGSSVWAVYHASATTANQYLRLEGTSGVTTVSGVWGSGVPTSTLVNYGSNLAVYANSTAVAYCWAEIAGFSKFGSYTGNGSTDGPFVYTGFRPKFVMIKRTDASGQDWILWDAARPNEYNTTYVLYPNTSAAEDTSGNIGDFYSNGFKPRTTGLACNASGGTFIYAAFAENPFKNALAR